MQYTIVEQHLYDRAALAALAWKDQASLAFAFLQMAGFNRWGGYDDAVVV